MKQQFLITEFCVLQNKEKFVAKGESKNIHKMKSLVKLYGWKYDRRERF